MCSETDAVIPALLTNPQVTGQVAAAVILTALLGAAMSSIDSVLLVAASAVDHDLLTSGHPQVIQARVPGAVRRTRVWVVLNSVEKEGS